MTILDAARGLRDRVGAIGRQMSVPFVYNPLEYAWDPHEKFLTKLGGGERRTAILVGMNPGPWGMGQTGVPFGDVTMVRDWMGITGKVDQPPKLHPKRPVTGFQTTRSEPSGTRLYGWAKERYGTAQRFFDEFFVVNYCPLLFFDDDGKNLTPPQLRKAEVAKLDLACDQFLRTAIEHYAPTFTIGVGGYAQACAKRVVDEHKLATRVGTILHPSPASPTANRGWAKQAEAQLASLGVKLP